MSTPDQLGRPLVVITSSFPIRGDGREAAGGFVADLVAELARHLDVRVVAPGREAATESWAEGVTVYRYATPDQPLSTLKPWQPRDAMRIARVLRAGQRASHAAAAGAQHILALWGLPCGEWARRAARRQGIGYSVWLLGSDVWSLGRMPVARQALARVMRGAQHCWADGYRLAEDGQRIGGVPVAFLPSTRKITLTNPPPPRCEPPYRLLFLGRWHRNKGVDLLLDALALLGEQDWQRIERVEIHGGGPLEALVRERAGHLAAAGRAVEVGGFLAKADAEAAIARADWVLIPSRIESIPVVFSDAMKLGRPVIATPVGDLPRLLQGRGCGVLADAATAPALAHALRTAVTTNPGDAAAMAQMASGFDLGSIGAHILAQRHG